MSGLAKPDNRISVDVKDGINDDIITVLQKRFPEAVKEAAPIAEDYKGATRLETAKNIWDWLKKDITYKRDPEGYQDVRMPRYFHHHKTGDCKSFTLNSLAIWHNLYPKDKIHFFYAGYTPGTDTPTHVYAKIKPANGDKEIIIDGCWYWCNSEKNYTFGKYSPVMQVRTLSGVESHHGRGHAHPYYDVEEAYYQMEPYERGRFEACLGDLVQLRLLELAKKHGLKSKEEIKEAVEGIAAKHKKKDGSKNRKALHYINAAALFFGRSCFLLFVTLNVNGLASKLQQLHKWGKDAGIMNMWYIMGGNTKKLLKIINKGAGKKKLFLSKKAKQKYEQRYGALSPNEVAYEKGVHGEIGVVPAIAAAAIGVVPILAGLIPKMIDGFRQAGPKGHSEVKGLIGEGTDLAGALQRNGYPLTTDHINDFGGVGVGPDGKPLSKGALIPKGEGYHYTFDWHNLHVISGVYDDPAAPDAAAPDAAAPDAPAPDMSTDSGYAPTPGTPKDQFSDTMKTLGPLLQTSMTAGLSVASSVMSQSNNPNIRKWGGALGGAESALTGQALKRAGYPEDAKFHDNLHKGKTVNLFPIALGAAALFVGYEVLNKKSA